ncbi:MAG TPA: hypothetical protein V6C91_00590, partial [Coleofasciculaceae cyanobacterium]
MVETLPTAEVASYNERSLKALDRAIALSQGEFSLVLVRCNYKRLREQMMHQLRQLSANRYEIRELDLPSSVTTLYTTIQAFGHGDAWTGDLRRVGERERGRNPLLQFRNKQQTSPKPLNDRHCALFILGLESVEALDDLLSSSNQVRDEFRKRLPFPLILWVNDEVLQKLVRFAPDFASWAAAPIKFEIATSELVEFLQQKADTLFKTVLKGPVGRYAPWRICTHHSTLNLVTGCRSHREIESALNDLHNRGQTIEPELEAS